MKTILIIVALLLGSTAINAQWYLRTCGVTDINNCTSEEFDCLWTQSGKLARNGTISTVHGTTIVVISMLNMKYEFAGISGGYTLFFVGTPVGILLDFIGIPCMATGFARRSHLKKSPLFNSWSAVELSLSPTLLKNSINNTYSMGLSASISF